MTPKKWLDLSSYSLKILFLSMATLGFEGTAVYIVRLIFEGKAMSMLPTTFPYNYYEYGAHIITTIIFVAWLRYIHPEKITLEL